MTKSILLRADGNSRSGLGHLYRMFALYEMCKDQFRCIMVTREDSSLQVIPGSLDRQLIPANITIHDEAGWLKQLFQPGEYLVVIDGYQFDSAYQLQIKNEGFKLICIDDLAEGEYYADVIINHAPSAVESIYQTNTKTQLALGTAFSLVRPLFLEAAGRNRKPGKMERAFVCFGGSDPLSLTEFTCKVLTGIKEIKKIHVIVGASNAHSGIRQLAESDSKIELFNNLSEAELLAVMENSDFAIAPTSTILFELCCVKMPLLTGYYVSNQETAYHTFVSEHAVLGAGDFRTLGEERLYDLVMELLNSDHGEMITNQARMFDGKQKDRITKLFKTI